MFNTDLGYTLPQIVAGSTLVPTRGSIRAETYIRRLSGISQSHLILADDGFPYVVKFHDNPQHGRLVLNEWIATKLAGSIGLSVPFITAIEVSPSFLNRNPGVGSWTDNGFQAYKPGVQFACRFAGGLFPGLVMETLPERDFAKVRNKREFSGIFAFDKWVSNTDRRQVVFASKRQSGPYKATFIDYGNCFNCDGWSEKNSAFMGLYNPQAYCHVKSWKDFDPWLSRIEKFDLLQMSALLSTIPAEWLAGEHAALRKLSMDLIERRLKVRALIEKTRRERPYLFMKWNEPEHLPFDA